ncbi:dihydrodipicolinate synthase family protein [Planctomycetaceae bacterium SH139]
MSLHRLGQLAARFRRGVFISAHPLALDANRRLDVRRQRALTRYYLDAGVDGLAVGVHTTQFAIREPRHGLLLPALQLAAETGRSHSLATSREQPLLIAGACGATKQAICEAEYAHRLGYDAVLLSLAALGSASDDEMIHHTRRVSEVMPIVGFYLQPAVGGRALSFEFWQAFAEIQQVVAIKIAPFNRYQTLDVVRAVSESTRCKEIALLTGNDDTIIHDLLSHYEFTTGTSVRHTSFSGGLLGHWAC